MTAQKTSELLEASNQKPSPKRRPPMWPWLVLLVLTLAAIYAYHETLAFIDALGQMGSDFAQLFKWLLSVLAE